MSDEYHFLVGKGWLPNRAAKIARKHGAELVQTVDPGCGCGYGCYGDCSARRRHWFSTENLGGAHDRAVAEAVEADLRAAGILED